MCLIIIIKKNAYLGFVLLDQNVKVFQFYKIIYLNKYRNLKNKLSLI